MKQPTHRQMEVIGLIGLAWSNRQIAKHLCLSESTVKKHISSAAKVLGLDCGHRTGLRIQLVAWNARRAMAIEQKEALESV